ncbi:hypothetical protein LFX25_01610 [Leptospira sp. FAT2]|uniref:hypothetical protein n=1 Tax=Leptospira sanjuanensis TaxID=2879643 RepID=UPI001EE82E76|nr:hypothetical protein [Leptospira sanjuanensis]MCG6191938.1 hypothetical protein [Leptospira sanjuanensis]
MFYLIRDYQTKHYSERAFKLSTIVKMCSFSLLFLMLYNCIAMRVYVAKPALTGDSSKYFTLNSIGAYQIERPKNFSQEPFAKHSPYLFHFVPKNLTNEYGTISELINQEINTNQDFRVGNTDKYLIRLIEYNLYSKDRCFSNDVGINLSIDVENIAAERKILEFRFKDNINSNVTDCYIVAASLPIFLGWFIYAPYIGFRGNREDQLNQVSKLALLEFLDALKLSLKEESKIKPIPLLRRKKKYGKQKSISLL